MLTLVPGTPLYRAMECRIPYAKDELPAYIDGFISDGTETELCAVIAEQRPAPSDECTARPSRACTLSRSAAYHKCKEDRMSCPKGFSPAHGRP